VLAIIRTVFGAASGSGAIIARTIARYIRWCGRWGAGCRGWAPIFVAFLSVWCFPSPETVP